MTHEQKHRLADYLFDEIGGIDDRFVAEAEAPYQKKQSAFGVRRFAILAVSLSLALTATLGIFIGSRLLGSKGSDAEALPEDAGAIQTQNQASTTVTDGFFKRLEAIKPQLDGYTVAAEDMDLLSPLPKLILQYDGEEDYRVHVLTEAEAETLLLELRRNSGTRHTPDADSVTPVRIWLAPGDGTVLSPCLEQGDGNVSYGTLFDYEPELEPSQAFTDTLCGILSQ